MEHKGATWAGGLYRVLIQLEVQPKLCLYWSMLYERNLYFMAGVFEPKFERKRKNKTAQPLT